jgi:hypothetical protein
LRELVRAEGKKTSQGGPGTVCVGKISLDSWRDAEDRTFFIMHPATP